VSDDGETFERAMSSDTPPDSPWWAAVWLTRRHARVSALCVRAGVAGAGDLDVDDLGAALDALDEYRTAWRDYARRSPEPSNDDQFTRWQAAGPQHPDSPAGRSAAAMGVMSSSELGILRVLGTLATQPTAFGIGSVWGFDNESRAFLRDWLRVVAPWAEPFPDPFAHMTSRHAG
jgi:hypothetical protein